MKTPKRKPFLARKLAALRDAAKALRAKEATLKLADQVEAALPYATVDCWYGTDVDASRSVDRFGEVAADLRALRKLFGRRPDSMPVASSQSLSRAWSWRQPEGRVTLTATLTGKVCRLEKIGEEVIHHPAHDEVRPIMRLVCPPEEVES